MEKEKMNILQKLLEIRKEVEMIKKEKTGDGIKYKFVNEEQILIKIKDTMNSLGLLLIPNIVGGTITTKELQYENNAGKQKKEVITQADMEYTWYDVETKEEFKTGWAMFGQNSSASQSYGSGLTYANKYYLLKFFNIATTDDDPDKIIQEQEEKELRKVISTEQTRAKKLYTKLLKVYQTKEKIYDALGMTEEDWKKKYNDIDKIRDLNEQMELIANDNN